MNTNESILQFLDGSGRLIRWPKKKTDKLNVLKYLQGKFEINTRYSELEVNNVLEKWHTFNDYALLRRELVENFLINRTPDCREYRLNSDAGDGSFINV